MLELWIIVLCWTWGILKPATHLRAPEVGSGFQEAGPSPPRLTATLSAQPGERTPSPVELSHPSGPAVANTALPCLDGEEQPPAHQSSSAWRLFTLDFNKEQNFGCSPPWPDTSWPWIAVLPKAGCCQVSHYECHRTGLPQGVVWSWGWHLWLGFPSALRLWKTCLHQQVWTSSSRARNSGIKDQL